jgi:hypothetical protein
MPQLLKSYFSIHCQIRGNGEARKTDNLTLRSGLRQLGTDEEPEEVAGSCDEIGSVISDCKRRLM